MSAQQTESFRNPVRYYNLGLEYFDKELFSEAQKEFERAQEEWADPNAEIAINSEYYSALCALKLFHRDASLRLRDFIRKHPESSKIRDARFQLGGYYYRKRDWDNVIAWYGQVDPYDLSKEEKAEYKFKLGYAHLMEKNLEKASRNFYEIKDVQNAYSGPARYYFAHISYTNENYQTAITDFRKLESHPKFGPIVPYYISQILYNQKKYDELLNYAPPLLETVIKKRRPELARLIGEAYYYERDYEEALPFLETYQKESRILNNDDRYQLAYTYYKTENYEDAIVLFSRLTGLGNEMAQTASYHLADCYIKTNQKNHARSAFKNAYDLGFDKKISEESLFNFARLSYEVSLDPYKNSVGAFQEYIAKYPESNKIDEAYRYLIAVYLTTRNYDAALTSIESVKSKTPQLKAAYQKIAYNKAIALYQNRDYRNAVVYFDKSHKYKHDEKLTALGFYWKGEARFRQREYDNAIENYQAFIYESAAILTPVFNLANYNIGYCNFKKENYADANVWFRKFIYTKEDIDSFKLNDALLRIADGYFMVKEYDQAIDFYSQAEQVGQFDNDYALFQRAVCEGISKNYKAKSSTLEELIAENPGSSYLDAAYYELGRAYNIQGENEKALASFNSVIQHENQNVYLKKSLISSGLIHYNSNAYDSAISIFTRIVDDYPTYQDTKEALAVLKNIYIERGEVDKYSDLVSGLSFVNVTKNELDSAVYDAAELSYMQNDCKKAQKDLKNYLEKFSPALYELKANYYLADCYYREDQQDSAVVFYQRIVEMPMNNYTEEAIVKSADYFFGNKNYSQAYRYYSELELSATSAPILRHAAGGKLESAFNLDSAEVAFAAAETYLGHGFKEQNYVAIAYLLKGRKAVTEGQLDNALEYFEIVQDTSTSELGAEAKYGMARINYERDSLQACETIVFELVNQIPSYGKWIAKSLILLSDVYVKKDDNFQAKAVLQSIISNYDGDDLKKVAQDKLNAIDDSEKKEDEQLEEAPDMEIEFNDEEGDNLDFDSIDALFEEEEMEEELPQPQMKEEDSNDK
ncbi:MAG: tetratricopeptide repeat protein [Salibacteraceae bacterium]